MTTVPVFTFQPDGLGVESSQLVPPDAAAFQLNASFTLCLWVRFYFISGPEKALNTIASFATRNVTNYWTFGKENTESDSKSTTLGFQR